MKIAFIGYNQTDASITLRAAWPADWLNKFTDHSAAFYSQKDVALPDSWAQFINTDVVVFHKQGRIQVEIAKKLRKARKDIVLVFDTDDNDPLVWDYYVIDHWFLDSWRRWDELVALCDGVTCASVPLMRMMREKGHRAVCIENGFDLTLSTMAGRTHDYWTANNPEGRAYKVVYGGGNNHYRELGWLIESGIFNRVCDEYPVDFHIYGIGQQPGTARRTFKRGTVTQARGVNIYNYIEQLYHDADLLIAPLLAHPFNDYRSTVKLVEAGVARKTILASDNATYREYKGVENVTLLPEDADAWCDAIVRHIENDDMRRERGERNRAVVEKHYDAQVLTEQRIRFYEQLLSKR